MAFSRYARRATQRAVCHDVYVCHTGECHDRTTARAVCHGVSKYVRARNLAY